MSTYDSFSCHPPQAVNEVLALGAEEILAATNVTSCDEPGVELTPNNQVLCQGGVCSLGTWKPRTKQFND